MSSNCLRTASTAAQQHSPPGEHVLFLLETFQSFASGDRIRALLRSARCDFPPANASLLMPGPRARAPCSYSPCAATNGADQNWSVRVSFRCRTAVYGSGALFHISNVFTELFSLDDSEVRHITLNLVGALYGNSADHAASTSKLFLPSLDLPLRVFATPGRIF